MSLFDDAPIGLPGQDDPFRAAAAQYNGIAQLIANLVVRLVQGQRDIKGDELIGGPVSR